MKPKSRSTLNDLTKWISDASYPLNRMAELLRNGDEAIPSEFAEVTAAIAACDESIQRLATKVDALLESDENLIRQASDVSLTEAEIDQLLALNRYLKGVTQHLIAVASEVRPRLDAKLADPADPMYDFEIEALVDYVLREDDADYDEDDDNYLSSRRYSLKHLEILEDMPSCSIPFNPARLWSEPHCWLFHELQHKWSSREAPRLSPRDLLRIGNVLVDVHVWQQYDFKVS